MFGFRQMLSNLIVKFNQFIGFIELKFPPAFPRPQKAHFGSKFTSKKKKCLKSKARFNEPVLLRVTTL
jgi:hypothetical protein